MKKIILISHLFLSHLLISGSASAAVGNIFKCQTPDNQVLYSDLPCNQAKPISLHLLPGLKLTPLNRAEAKQLTQLQKRSNAAAGRQANSSSRAKQQRFIQNLRDRKLACIEFKDQLDNLRAHKRRGYKLSESASFKQREKKIKRGITMNC